MAAVTTPAAPEQSAQTPAATVSLSQSQTIEGFRTSPMGREETFQEKLSRKTKANPFVPIGCLTTAGVLIYGLRAFKQGKTKESQLLMRGRILAQGFTVVALIVGVITSSMKSKQ